MIWLKSISAARRWAGERTGLCTCRGRGLWLRLSCQRGGFAGQCSRWRHSGHRAGVTLVHVLEGARREQLRWAFLTLGSRSRQLRLRSPAWATARQLANHGRRSNDAQGDLQIGEESGGCASAEGQAMLVGCRAQVRRQRLGQMSLLSSRYRPGGGGPVFPMPPRQRAVAGSTGATHYQRTHIGEGMRPPSLSATSNLSLLSASACSAAGFD